MKQSALYCAETDKQPGLKNAWKLFILMLFAAFSACEYQLKEEEFVDINPPEGIEQFTINMMEPGDTLILFNPTTLKYDINAYGLDILTGKLRLAGKSWPITKTGEITLNPEDFNPGIHTLKLLLMTNSGTGSIADITGSEGYVVGMEWIAVVDNRGGPYMPFIKTINQDGFLTLKWNPVKNLNFSHYELKRRYGNERYVKHIYNVRDTTFIDSCYFAGEAIYEIHTFVKTQGAGMGYGGNFHINDPFPQLRFQMNGLDSVDISWNKTKYATNYTLYDISSNTPNLIFSGTDTSHTFLSPPFGSFNRYKFEISPLYPSPDCQFTYTQYEDYAQGKPLNARTLDYACNTIDGLIYTDFYSLLNVFDVQTLNQTDSVYMTRLSGLFSCPPNSTKLAAFSLNKNILVFDNKQLENPLIIPFNHTSLDYLRLTTNNLIAAAKPNSFILLNTETQQPVSTLDIDDYPYYSVWACLGCSPQGQFAAVCTNNGIRIYDISGHNFDQIYQDSRNYRSLLFNDSNDNELYITLNDQPLLEVRSAADFNLLRNISLPGSSVICNVDPYTGYMLLTDFTSLHILDLNSGQIKLSMKSVDRRPRLFNGWLLSESGSALNLSSYLL